MGATAADATALDAVDYDAVKHLNMLFAHPSAVSSVSRVAQTLRSHADDATRRMAALETARTQAPFDPGSKTWTKAGGAGRGKEDMQAELASVFARVEHVRARAARTERDITSMTAEIKRLDSTKRNLTLSMTALKRLQMLTAAYEQLRVLARSRQYRECAGLLAAALQLMRHFASYRSVEQIAVLGRHVAELQRELLEQVCKDFEQAFGQDEVAARRAVLGEACLVMDALGEAARTRLVRWYVNLQLREYRKVFRGSVEAGSLDNIARRYAWFRRMIKTHDDEHASTFPAHWRLTETLAMAFCDDTRQDLEAVLEKSMRRTDAGRVDVDLLLRGLQETMDFEQTLARRFASDPRASVDTLDERSQPLHGSISAAFAPYLGLWVESQDRQLAAMMPRYKQQALLPDDEEFSPQAVMASAIELFHFYKLTLSQCAKLSAGERLLDLSRTLARYLDEYAQQALLYVLQKGGTHGPPIRDIVLVLNTADFWHANTSQLEQSIRKRIDADMASKVDLSCQSDAFMGVASAAVLALVRKVDVACEGGWREMRNTHWGRMDSVSDQSSYVGELVRQMHARTAEILPLVAKPHYARAFCDNLVEHVAQAYVANVVQCRPVCEVGAEQMLLDKYVLTKAMEKLMSHHSPSQQPPAATFVKRANQTMNRIDALLKTLQVRPSPPEALVQAYLIHIGDRCDANFRKVLELKGVQKQDQPHLMELFAMHRDAADRPHLVQASPLLTPLLNTSSTAVPAPGGVTSPAGMGAPRFDAASLGEKLLNAARDGVERMGSASTAAAVAEKATINENLKSFGKFFKRDMLGGRFGKRDTTPTGGGEER